MNRDFRVHVDYFNHPKTVSLVAANGELAATWPLRLWAFAAKHKPSGNLGFMAPREFELATGIHRERAHHSGGGKSGEEDAPHPLDELCRTGFLDVAATGALVVHGWKERNPWAADAQARSVAASKAGRASALKRKGIQYQRQANGSFGSRSAAVLNGSPNGSPTPSPSPSPSPSPKAENQNLHHIPQPAANDAAGVRTLVPVPVPHEKGHVTVPKKAPARPKRGSSPLVLPRERLAELEKLYLWLYEGYPRHVGYQAGWRAFVKLEGEITREFVAGIAKNVKRRVDSGEWEPENPERKRFIPHIATYLNNRRWEDED